MAGFSYVICLVVGVILLVDKDVTGSDSKTPSCSHNFFLGEPNANDVLLFRTEVDKPKHTRLGFGVKTIEEITYPSNGVMNTKVITAIRAFDLLNNGTGGHIDRTTFTADHRGVTLRLKSERGEGYKFLIEIWGS